MYSTSPHFKERTRLGDMSIVRDHLTPSIPPSGAAGVLWLKADLSTSFSGLTPWSGSLSDRIRSKPCTSFWALHSTHPPLQPSSARNSQQPGFLHTPALMVYPPCLCTTCWLPGRLLSHVLAWLITLTLILGLGIISTRKPSLNPKVFLY